MLKPLFIAARLILGVFFPLKKTLSWNLFHNIWLAKRVE